MDLLGSLSTLATNVKNVTLPGILAAVAFALLLWPPRPYDRIPSVVDNHLNIATLKLSASQFANDSDVSLGEYLDRSGPACTVREGAESYTFLAVPLNFRQRAAVAVKNQLVLDDTDRTLNKCVEEEQALQGVDDQAIANINLLITTRTNERDGINTLYQKYILALSPMQGEFRSRLECKEEEIAALQAHLLNFQRIQKERARRVSQLQRLDKEMQARLQDGGRLRPVQKFDDILGGLTSHIVGILTLVFGWGLLIDPINRALFSFIYDNVFRDEWESVQPARPSPGDDARRKWEPKEGDKPALRLAPELAKNAAAPPAARSTEPHKLTFEEARSSPAWSLLVWVVCGLFCLLIVTIGEAPNHIKTTTIVSVDSVSPANPVTPSPSANDPKTLSSIAPAESATSQFRFTAIVAAPSSAYPPDGEVQLCLHQGSAAEGSYSTSDCQTLRLDNGSAHQDLTLKPGDYQVVATYLSPTEKSGDHCGLCPHTTEKPAEHCEGCPPFDGSTSGWVPFTLARATTTRPEGEDKCKLYRTRIEQIAFDTGPIPLQVISAGSGPSVPDLSKPDAGPFWKPLIKCLLVLALAMCAGLFAPGILSLFAPRTVAEAPPTRKKAAAFRRSLEGDATVKLTCEQKLAMNWEKLSEPAYAIGQGLIARSDFDALQNRYYSQSLISTGLIIPLVFFIFALLVTPQLGTGQPWLYGILGVGGVVLLITGVDLRHKYFTELDSLISAAFLVKCGQDDKTEANKKAVTLAGQIADAIGKAKVMESSDWILSVEEPPAPPPPGSAQPTPDKPTPPAGSSTPSVAEQNTGALDAAASAAEILRRLTKMKLERSVSLKVPDPAASTSTPPLTNQPTPGASTPAPSGPAQPPKPKPAAKPPATDEGKK